MFGTGILYLRGETNIFGCIDLFEFFGKYFLPPVMHPEIVSGMGIATKYPFGTESSLSNDNMMQCLLEQVNE